MHLHTCFKAMIAVMALLAVRTASAAGGPDSFGYIWQNSADPGGPPPSWIDISALGEPVLGLGDDNSAPLPVNLPRAFRYYWRDYTSLRIGSNGWVGFTDASNIASCFPTIPVAGGAADSYLAPLLADLNFTGAGNPGSVRQYFDALENRFIVSYINVPFWVNSPLGWTGSNNFQVVLDYDDLSIQYNYQGLSGFANTGCVDLTTGIESPNGLYGLQVVSDTLPTTNQSLRFTYPAVPGIAVVDLLADKILDSAGNAGLIVEVGTSVQVQAIVRNEGNTATTGTPTLRAEMLVGLAGTNAYDQNQALPALAAGGKLNAGFTSPYLPTVGTQLARFTISGGGDINPDNDVRTVDLFGLDPQGGAQLLSWVEERVPNGSINWNGGTTLNAYGMATEFVIPIGYSVTRIGARLQTGPDGYAMEIRDNNGANGFPGTLLARIDVLAGSVTPDAWQDFDVPLPVSSDGNGLYLVWYQQGVSAFLGTVDSGAPSRRNLELLNGSFASYRNSATQDVFLRLTTVPIVDSLFDNGFE